MNKETFAKAVDIAKKASPKRKFKQTYDLIINLKDVNLKKPEEQVNLWVALPHSKGKKTKIACLVGPELMEQAKTACDFTVLHDDFPKYTARKDIRRLARGYDYFVAQANIMPDVAKTFGRVFGPKGKMPNPKAGCVVPPNANLKALTEKLSKTIQLVAKTQPTIKCAVGIDEMPDEQVVDNIMTVFTSVTRALPQERNNVKNILLKLTMGPPVKITERGVEGPTKPEEKPKEKIGKPKEKVAEKPKETKPVEAEETPKEKPKAKPKGPAKEPAKEPAKK
jgi:large subunit ribosomal protein L1